jgi:hypothetical protein
MADRMSGRTVVKSGAIQQDGQWLNLNFNQPFNIAQTRFVARGRFGTMINLESGAWRRIAAQVSTEMNPTKLSALVEQLCRAIDQENQPTSVAPEQQLLPAAA